MGRFIFVLAQRSEVDLEWVWCNQSRVGYMVSIASMRDAKCPIRATALLIMLVPLYLISVH